MTAPGLARALRAVAIAAIAVGCLMLWNLAVLAPADARPGGGGGRGARVNVGPRFNAPRPPPTRPPSASQLPARPPGAGQGQRPGAPGAGDGARPGVPHPEPPIAGVKPPRPGAPDRPIDRPPVDRPPVDHPGYYPPYYPGYYPPYPGYWPPPYPPYDDAYPAPAPPASPPPAPSSGTIVGSVPADCRQVGVASTTYLLCGRIWYAPRFSGNQIVYVVVDPPT